MGVYTLTKSFSTRVERSERVLAVAEAFGLGLEEGEFTLFKNLELEVNPGDVVYITGQSGSGKSQLLRMLSAAMTETGLQVADFDHVALKDKPIIDQIGSNMTEAIELLSRAGINDAYLTIRKPQELSDGQRYRLKLAKLMENDADVWVCDEFGAVLDRITAKTVAFNSQKLARVKKRILIVATTHTDLVTELAPSLIIEKHYKDRIKITRN